MIRVSDDGRGIGRKQVIRRAVASGLLAEGAAAVLSDDEVYRLILRPGFSTAEHVTDVSGRGVGLDVLHARARRGGHPGGHEPARARGRPSRSACR